MKLEVLQNYGLNPVRPHFLDSSSLRTFIACPSMYYFRYVLGLRKRIADPSGSMEWGTCWHGMLEAYHNAGRGQAGMVAALEVMEELYPTDLTPTTDRYKRSKQRMAKGFMDYVELYAEEDAKMEFLRNEQHFQIYSEEDDLEWSGRMDSVRKRKGKICAWDYKSTSSMGSTYFDQFELGFQFPGYVWAARQITNEPVNEITIDVFYTISKKQEFFRRTFRYHDSQLQEWVDNVKWWTERLHYLLDNHLYEPSAWGKNWDHCNSWYGRKCPFFDIHNTAPIEDSRLLIAQHEYVEDRWDPGAD